MMSRKEKGKRQSVTDEDRMIGDEPAVSQSMELSVGEVFQNSQTVNNTESATSEKCVSNLRNCEEEHWKGNSHDCVVVAEPLKAKLSHFYSESRIEEKKSEKVDVCKMKNLLVFARNRVRENMKELSHCMNMHGKTSMEEKEVEKNNCMHPLSSSISEKRNSEILEEVMNFERFSDLSLGMATAVDRRLKVIAEKLSLVENDEVAGRPPTKSTLSDPSVDNCDRGGVGKEDSENSNPNAELRSLDKIDASLTKSTKQLQINASELNSSFTDMVEESLNLQECAAPREGPDVSLNMKAEDEIPVMNSKSLNSSFTDVVDESLNEQECVTSREGSDVSLNMEAEDEIPVMNSKGQGKEDDPSSKSLPNLEVSTSSKRSFPFGNSKKLIPAMKRVKVNSDDCSERIESRYMQSMELSSQNVCSVPSPYRTLKVDLGYKCDSSEFQMELRRWNKNCSYLSKKSINHLKRIKTENGSLNKENCCNVVSVKHKMVKREEVEISSQVKHGLMGTFDEVSAEVCSQRNTVDECLVKEEVSGDHLQIPTKGDLPAFKVQRQSVRGFKKAIPSKELTSERLKTAVQRMEIKIKEESVELQEEFQMQMDCHSSKKETKCNISSVEEVEVLKIIKPVRVSLGYRCDSKVTLTRDKLVS